MRSTRLIWALLMAIAAWPLAAHADIAYQQISAGVRYDGGATESDADSTDTVTPLHAEYTGHNVTASADSRIDESTSLGVKGQVSDLYDYAGGGEDDYKWTGSFSAAAQHSVELYNSSVGYIEVPVSVHAELSIDTLDYGVEARSQLDFGISIRRDKGYEYETLASWGGRIGITNTTTNGGPVVDPSSTLLPSDDSVTYEFSNGTLLLSGSTSLLVPLEYEDATYLIGTSLSVGGSANSRSDGVTTTSLADAYNSIGFGDGHDFLWDVMTGTAGVSDADHPERTLVPEPATLTLALAGCLAIACKRRRRAE